MNNYHLSWQARRAHLKPTRHSARQVSRPSSRQSDGAASGKVDRNVPLYYKRSVVFLVEVYLFITPAFPYTRFNDTKNYSVLPLNEITR